jgi:hypothetical protein
LNGVGAAVLPPIPIVSPVGGVGVAIGNGVTNRRNGSGEQLTPAEQATELATLNPMVRTSTIASLTTSAAMLPARAAVLKPFVGNGTVKREDDRGEEEDCKMAAVNAQGSTNSNSTNEFTPHHMLFQYSTKDRSLIALIIINIPSGVAYKGLDGKVHATVSSCLRKVSISCAWPKVFTSPKWLVQGVQMPMEAKEKEDHVASIYNMVAAFKDELHAIRDQHRLLDNVQLGGGVAVIPLPFEVEKEIYYVNTCIDAKTAAVTMFLALKEFKKTQVQKTLKMEIQVTGQKKDDFADQFDE